MKDADQMTDGGDVSYVPHYSFNNYHLWAIYHDNASRGMDFKEYIATRKGLPDLHDTRFPSGGWISTVMGDNSPGHLELTSDILKSFGFTSDAIAVAGDASQDPDFYEWGNPRAHAQTKNNDNDGRCCEDQDFAINEYISWVRTGRDGILKYTKSPEKALFFLGYTLHGIQDLAAHQGVTNAMHAYESYISPGKDNDPDHLPVNRDYALKYSEGFLNAFKAKNPDLFKSMQGYESKNLFFSPKVSKADKCKLLGKKDWDFSIGSFMEYKGLAGKYEKIKGSEKLDLWPRDRVFERIFKCVL